MSCDSDYIFDALTKDPGTTRAVELDMYELIVKEWIPNSEFATGAYVRPPRTNGFSVQAQDGGTSGDSPPRFPATLNEVVKDGSINWICKPADNNSFLALASPNATPDPAGLTITSVSISNDRYILATYAGGVLGQDYDAVFTFTVGGLPFVARQTVKIRKQ